MDWDPSVAPEAPDPPLSSRASVRALLLFAGGLLVGVQVVGRVEAASFTPGALVDLELSPARGVDLVGSDPEVIDTVFIGAFSSLFIFAGAVANTGFAGF